MSMIGLDDQASAVAAGIALAAGLYGLAGIVFAAGFVICGVHRVDPAARGAAWPFRVLILPGVAMLWPLLARLWLRAVRMERER